MNILLPYKDSLEHLLESLFADDEEEEFSVIKLPFPFPAPMSRCCTYNYGPYYSG